MFFATPLDLSNNPLERSLHGALEVIDGEEMAHIFISSRFFLECFKIACFILGDDCTYIHMHVWKAHCFVAFIKSK